MKLVKISEIKGAALDFAVAQCLGLPLKLDPMGFKKDSPSSSQSGWWVWEGQFEIQEVVGLGYSPSTNWLQGGPIIEREKINLMYTDNQWEADTSADCFGLGNTALKAAMRCYVANKIGLEIEVPKELLA